MSARVLAVLHEDRDGGATRALRRVVPFLEERGYEFEFWAPVPSPVACSLTAEGRPVHGAPRLVRYRIPALREPPGTRARLASVPGYLRAFARTARGFDVIHLNTLLTFPEGLAARRSGAARVAHVHEILPGGARGRLTRLALPGAADLVVAVSEAAARPLGARVIPNGVALGEPVAARSEAPLVVGAVGTVSPRKGSDLVLEVARRAGPAVELRMIGPLAPGPGEAWARELVERARGAGVRYEGPRADPLAGLDAVLMPSREDPFPLVVLEAMAAGLPVVGAAVDGIPEQLGEDSGLLVPPEDAGAMARALAELAGDPGRRARLGAAARERVAARFTLERQAEGLADAYEAALRAYGAKRL